MKLPAIRDQLWRMLLQHSFKKKKQLIQSYVSPNKTHLFLFVKSSILYTVSEPQQQKKAPHQKKKRAEYFKLADFWGYFHTII